MKQLWLFICYLWFIERRWQ